MTDERLLRVSVLMLLLALLGGLFVLGGTDWPASPTVGPDPVDVAEEPEEFIDEEVHLSGEIIDAEEAVVEVEYGDEALGTNGEFEVELEGVPPEELEEGHELTVGGELVDEETVDVADHPFATRAPWERQYMYAISLVGALLAVGYGLNTWRFDIREFGVEPRETTLLSRLSDRGDVDG